MQKLTKILGESQSLTALEAVHLLESSISEGILTPPGWEQKPVEHLFDRPPNRFTSNDLSFVLGIASSGLRTSGFVSGKDLIKNLGQLSDLGRQHLGAVIHLIPTAGELNSPAVGTASPTGCFQMIASNVQEAIDFTLIAHRVAELSLIPGILQIPARDEKEGVQFPDQRTIQQLLGDPDEQIACPTPAQKMLFGDTRRRIPNWFNFDFPTVNGVQKDPNSQSLEAAARQRFFQHHLPEIFTSVFEAFEKLTGRKYASVSTNQVENADYVLVSPSSVFQKATAAVDQLRNTKKAKVGCLKFNLLHPFPTEELTHLLAGKKIVTVLEAANGAHMNEPPIFTEIKAALSGIPVGGNLW
jgi:pyruvate-ferredoxin/flavodoxin oxidoreductase